MMNNAKMKSAICIPIRSNHILLTLLSFLNPSKNTAFSQLVVLRSIARQYGLQVLVIVPKCALGLEELANFAYDWQEDAIRVYVDVETATHRFGAGVQTTFLVENNSMVGRWDGWVSPSTLAIAVQKQRGLPILVNK